MLENEEYYGVFLKILNIDQPPKLVLTLKCENDKEIGSLIGAANMLLSHVVLNVGIVQYNDIGEMENQTKELTFNGCSCWEYKKDKDFFIGFVDINEQIDIPVHILACLKKIV